MLFREQPIQKAVTFSFDDGVTQDIRMIELLDQYGLKATFNLNSQLLGQPGLLHNRFGRISHYKLSPADVKDIYAGHEVAAHTLTHPRLTELEDNDILCQVEGDRQALSELVGYEVVGLAYPCGGVNHDERVRRLIREHTKIRYCRTITNRDSFDPQPDLYCLDPNTRHRDWDRIWDLGRSFVELKAETPQIFYIWGHTYEMDFASENWDKLEEFFRFIAGRDDIFYGTNAEVFL